MFRDWHGIELRRIADSVVKNTTKESPSKGKKCERSSLEWENRKTAIFVREKHARGILDVGKLETRSRSHEQPDSAQQLWRVVVSITE
jgi:hypothetical protein